MKRLILRRLTQSQKGIRKTQNHSNSDNIDSIFNREEEPLNEVEAPLFRRCINIL